MPRKIQKIVSLLLCICFTFQQIGFAQVLPLPQINLPQSPALLRYLSVNSANPFNYFNFLMDKGHTPGTDHVLSIPENGKGPVPNVDLNSEAKKLINYFFLGITLPSDDFWVNLRPDEPGRITSETLGKTDMGRMLLEQDLQLKRDVAKYLHPANPKGKEFWEALYTKIGKDKIKKAKITTSNRVWIVPDGATVVETEDGALVTSAKLKVLLENEYLSSLRDNAGDTSSVIARRKAPKQTQEANIQLLSESLMKQIILPAITEDVNNSPTYAPLRQIYYSLVLAEWFKRKHKMKGLSLKGTVPDTADPYVPYINSGVTAGLESELPWSKQKIWQDYLNSYEKGEYKLEDTLFGLKRMYFSGGIKIDPAHMEINISSSAILGGDKSIRNAFQNTVGLLTPNKALDKNKIPVDPEKIEIIGNTEAPSPEETKKDEGLPAVDRNLLEPTQPGASNIESASSSITTSQVEKGVTGYISKWKYGQGDETVNYSLKDGTVKTILRLLEESGIDAKKKQEILDNPQILAKLSLSYEFAPFIGKKTSPEQEEFINELIKKYATKDKVSEFVRENLKEFYDKMQNDPDLFAQANIIFDYYAQGGEEALKENLGRLFKNEISPDEFANLAKQVIGKKAKSGSQKAFSLFFNNPGNKQGITLDFSTMAMVFDYVKEAHKAGLDKIELAFDFLPFDWTKRLPGEYSDIELAQIKALAKLYGISISIHGALVGPIKGGAQLFFDPADNLELYKEQIAVAEKMGACNLVVHAIIDEGRREEKAKAYAELVLFAKGKDVKITFENYNDKSNKYPAADEFADFIDKIAEHINNVDSGALKNLGAVIDVAHLNLVESQEDPLVAGYKLAERLGQTAKRYNLNPKALLWELHINQNLGKIGWWATGKRFSADIHGGVENKGPIFISGIIALMHSLGFQPIITIEQIPALTDGAKELINMATEEGLKSEREGFDKVVERGEEIIHKLKSTPGYALLISSKEAEIAYAYIAGLFGDVQIKAHLDRRIAQHLFTTGTEAGNRFLQKFIDAGLVPRKEFKPNEVIIEEGSIGREFYIIMKGKVGVYNKAGELIAELGPGNIVGEIALLKEDNMRTATVKAGNEKVELVIIGEGLFKAYRQMPDFMALLEEWKTKRAGSPLGTQSASSAVGVGKKIIWLFFSKRTALAILEQGKFEIEKVIFDKYDIKIKGRNNIEVWFEVSPYYGRITKISIFRKGRPIKIKSDNLYGTDEEFNLLKNKILTNLSDYAARNKNSQDRESHLSLLELKLNDQYDSKRDDIEEFMKLIRQSGDYNYVNLLEIEQISKDRAGYRNLFYWLKLASSKKQNLGSALKEYQDLAELLEDRDAINKAILILDKNREITLEKLLKWINRAVSKHQPIAYLLDDLKDHLKVTALLLGKEEYNHNLAWRVDNLLKQNKEIDFDNLLGWIRTVKENNKDPELFLDRLEDIYKDTRIYLAEGFLEEEKNLLTDVLIKNGGKLLLALWGIPDRGYLSMLLKLSSTRVLERYRSPNSYNKEIKDLLLKYIDLLEDRQILSLFKTTQRDFLKELLIKKVENDSSFVPLLLEEIKLSADATGDTNSQLASILIEAKNTNEVIKKIISDGAGRAIKEEYGALFHYVVNLNLVKNEKKLKELIEEDPGLFNKLFDAAIHGNLTFYSVNLALKDIPQIKITPAQLLDSLKSQGFYQNTEENKNKFITFALLKDRNLFSIILRLYLEEKTLRIFDVFNNPHLPDELRLEFIREFLEKFITLPLESQEEFIYDLPVIFRSFLINNAPRSSDIIELLAKALKEAPKRIRNTVKLFDTLVEVGFTGGDWDVSQDVLNNWISTAQNEGLGKLIEALTPYGFQFRSNQIEILTELFNQKDKILQNLKEIRQIAPNFKYVVGRTDPDTLFIVYLIDNPKLFFENLEAILSRFNPEIFSYSEKIKITFSSLDTPNFLIESILDGTLNKALIETNGNLLEAIKSQSQLTNDFSFYLINNPKVFKRNLEMILQVFNPSLIPEVAEVRKETNFQFLNYIMPYILGASDFKRKFGEALFSLFKESDEEVGNKIKEFILREKQDIEDVFGYLQNNKAIPPVNFLKNFLRKNDASFLDILLPLKKENISGDTKTFSQLNFLLNTEKKYEAIRKAVNYLIEIELVVKGASLYSELISQEIDAILEKYGKEEIGNKKLLSELKTINDQVKAEAFRKIINRDLADKEKEFLSNLSLDSYIGNLIGLYFRLKNNYPRICKKIAFSIENLLKSQDVERFHQWLFKESDWNKEIYEELINSGYSSLFWDRGIRKTFPIIEGIEEHNEEKMKKQTEQLIELTEKHNIEIESQYKEKGIVSSRGAEEFATKYLLTNEGLSQEIKDLVGRIIEDTKRYEEQYKNKILSSKKVTVEIVKDFLKDTYSGVGIPGCFAPHGFNNQMPIIHSLETNALFLRVYDSNNKMIANAVLALTPQGIVVQGLYNASNLDLDKICFESLAELLLKDMVPAVLFISSSVGIKKSQKYTKNNPVTAVKKNNLDVRLYFDFSTRNTQLETEFNMDTALTKQDLLEKGFKPSYGEIEERSDVKEKVSPNKPLSKDEKKKIMQELFALEGVNKLELGLILKNIEKIIFEYDENKIEEIISSLNTRSPPHRVISEEEKGILMDKLAEIRHRFQENKEKESAASPVEKQKEDAASSAAEEGRCVTADTLLPILRLAETPISKSQTPNKSQLPNSNVQNKFNFDSTSAVELVPIVKVKPGDYVLSLNEEAQTIESHRIKGLLDMGVKPVYKLTTASGRSIKTTANHPYLTKGGWVKVSQLKAGDEIGVPSSDFANPVAVLLEDNKATEQVFFRNPVDKVVHQRYDFSGREKAGAQQDNSAARSNRITQDVSEISISGNKDKRFFLEQFVDFFIRGRWPGISNIADLVSGGLKNSSDAPGAVGINKESHKYSGGLSEQFFYISKESPVQDAGPDIFNSNGSKLFFDGLKIHSCGQGLKDDIGGGACPPNAGSSVLDVRVNCNMSFQQFFIKHTTYLLSQIYHTLKPLSSLFTALTETVAYAQPASATDLLWDKIASLEPLAPEQVYDIEVEGTHNFIGNGIFAHNTYINEDESAASPVEEIPKSFEEYLRLREQEIKDLRKKFYETFAPRSSEVERILNRPPIVYSLTIDDKMKELISAADKFSRSYPQGKIVSLGRTPLWFLETAELIKERRGLRGERYIYAAFSGRWYEKKQNGYVSGPAYPNAEQITAYRAYLTNIGLDPVTINKSSKPFIIVEYTQSGESLASFLSILTAWAKEIGVEDGLRRKITIHLLQDPMLAKIGSPFDGFNVIYQPVDHELVRDLANSDIFDDSLGIHYPYWEWNKINPLESEESRNAKLVRFMIIDYLISQNEHEGAFVQSPAASPLQTQETISSRIEQANPPKHTFIKDAPTLGYRITSSNPADLPQAIHDALGALDQTGKTGYSNLEKYVGSIVNLQMKDAKTPDFYPLGLETLKNKYREVGLSEVEAKNGKYLERLEGVLGDLLKSGDKNLVAVLRTTPQEMVKMSEIGYPVQEEVIIEVKWGETPDTQTKPAGQDAYLTHDGKQWYMVNLDDRGLPVSYVPASISSAIKTHLTDKMKPVSSPIGEEGGIDLTKIEIALKDEKIIASLNPADIKVLRAAKALKDNWDSLSILYVHEIMLLLKDGIVKDMQNKELLQGVLQQLKIKDVLDRNAMQFLQLMQSDKPLAEIKIAMLS